MEQLLNILNSMFPAIDFAKEESLIDSGLIESAALIELISEIEDSFNVEIDMEYIQPKYFQSANCMFEMLKEIGADV